MDNKIGLGVIGVGNISGQHIRETQASPDAEVTAICDINPDVLRTKGDLYGIPENRRFTDYHDLLACADVDAVSICTPNNWHFQPAIDAANANKPFAVEKPMTLNYDEALRLKRTVEANGVAAMVCFSYRFKTAARFARWLVQEGHIGRIHQIYVQYLQGWGLHPSKAWRWRFDKDISGSGALGDLGCHMLDVVGFIGGMDYESVSAQAGLFVDKRQKPDTGEWVDVDIDDYCNIMASMSGGAAATFGITRYAYGRANYQRIEFYGDKGGLVYSLDAEDKIEVCIGDVYRDARDYHEIAIPDSFKSGQMQSFFDLINGKGDGLTASIAEGCKNQLLLDSIVASFENKKWVNLGEKA